MVRSTFWAAICMGVCLVAGGLDAMADGAKETPRMTKETLKGMMETTDLVILDIRTGKDWDASEFKIKGAVRVDPGKFDEWKDRFSREKTLVLYCA